MSRTVSTNRVSQSGSLGQSAFPLLSFPRQQCFHSHAVPTSDLRDANLTTAIASVTSPGKRKVTDFFNSHDLENVDPALLLSKRAKVGSDGLGKPFFKPYAFQLTKSSSVPSLATKNGASSASLGQPATVPRARTILNPKSPVRKVATSLAKNTSSPMSAPAGRSPTRGNKRIGILNRRRVGRVDPPSFNLFSGGFSLDAAIKGSVPSYASSRSSTVTSSKAVSVSTDSLYDSSFKSSWFFDIHEDTPEQEMTNLLQHSTCMLDISSDEECEKRMRKGRGKENIPPADDISQISTRRDATTVSQGGMEYEKPRIALGNLNAEDFYAEGVDPSDVIIVPGDDEDGIVLDGEAVSQEFSGPPETDFAPDVKDETRVVVKDVEAPKTPVMAPLQPLEDAGESFDLWESASSKEEGDNAPSPLPQSPSSQCSEEL